MEEADKVSSSAPDEGPRDIAMNEAAAVGPTQTDARDAEEERTGKSSPPQTTEETDVSKITEETSAPQTNEVTSTSQTTEVTNVSTPQTTEVTLTSTPQTTEITNVSNVTPQTSEKTSDPQTTEVTSTPQILEETSIIQTTEETSVSKITEETSSPPTTEVTSPPQIPEVTSPPQIPEVTSPPQIPEVTSSAQPAEESVAPVSEVPVRRVSTEAGVTATEPVITDAAVTPETAEEAVTPPVSEAVTPHSAAEGTSPPRTEASADLSSEAREEEDQPPRTLRPSPSHEPEPAAAPVTPAAAPAVAPVTPAAAPAAAPAVAPVTPAAAPAVAPVTPAAAPAAAPAVAPVTPAAAPAVAPVTPAAAPAVAPPAAAPALFQPNFPSDHWDSPSVASTDLTMDPLGHKDSAGFDPDVLSQSDDDFMFELKKSPFQEFSPLNDSLGEAAAARKSVEVSDSPSPDLVQDAYDGDEGHVLSESGEIQQEAGADAALSEVNVTTSDDRPMSLPDILKSSPMNPEKVDSGSSEGSPEFSPVHRSVNDSPNSPFSVSANNLLGFDSKILLLKEMAEVTEARIAEKAKLEEEKSEPSFVAFDLVKETDVSPKSDGLLKDKDGVEVFSQTSVQTAHRFECLSFPPGKAQEHWDSESPSADSFSPVLDAVTHKPPSFTAEQEQRAADEASEPEPSSEEFEFVERPPRGAADEFLETQDSPTFTKPSEVALDEDRSPELEAQSQSSYHLHSQPSDTSSAVRGKAGLESDFQELSPTPVICPPADEYGAGKQEAEGEGGSPMSDVSVAAVLELLYWRDVKSSALVFGSSLFILLSLTCCSIISVLSYAALALLSITLSFRIYKGVLQAVQKSDEGHPFKWVLEKDVALSSAAVQRHSDVTLSRINGVLKELRRLFLVEDLIDSLKFAVLLWVFTYVGAWFNGLTLLILGLVGAFSGPLTYEKHQTQIDQFMSTVNSQMKGVLGKILAMVPGAKKKPE